MLGSIQSFNVTFKSFEIPYRLYVQKPTRSFADVIRKFKRSDQNLFSGTLILLQKIAPSLLNNSGVLNLEGRGVELRPASNKLHFLASGFKK
jgi:hypothetical protein